MWRVDGTCADGETGDVDGFRGRGSARRKDKGSGEAGAMDPEGYTKKKFRAQKTAMAEAAAQLIAGRGLVNTETSVS